MTTLPELQCSYTMIESSFQNHIVKRSNNLSLSFMKKLHTFISDYNLNILLLINFPSTETVKQHYHRSYVEHFPKSRRKHIKHISFKQLKECQYQYCRQDENQPQCICLARQDRKKKSKQNKPPQYLTHKARECLAQCLFP